MIIFYNNKLLIIYFYMIHNYCQCLCYSFCSASVSTPSDLEWILDKNWPIVLYRGATRSVTIREECGLRVSVENRVLRRMFKPNGDEITRGCRNSCVLYYVLIG